MAARKTRRIASLSAAGIAAIAGTQARSQCTPNPTVTGVTTVCSGAASQGLTLNTSSSLVRIVASGMLNSPGSGIAALSAQPFVDHPTSGLASSSVLIEGAVDGGAAVGIEDTLSAAGFRGVFLPSLAVTIDAGGIVAGATAIQIESNALASLDNAGSIRSGTGSALVSAATGTITGFNTITNRTGGYIGGVDSVFGALTNAGTIETASGSAVNVPAADAIRLMTVRPGITNAGTIDTTSGTAATIAIAPQQTVSGTGLSVTVNNTGAIVNHGTGAALTGDALVISNAAGANIATSGATAIVGSAVALTNRGTITGSVVAQSVAGGIGSVIDSSSGGAIIGDVTLGDADDTVVANYRADGVLATGIAGRVDPGGGTNTLRAAFTTDTSVATPIVLPAGFQTLGLSTNPGVTVTLGNGFVPPADLTLSGNGTIIVGTRLTATTIDATGGTLTMRNQGILDVSRLGLSLAALDNSGSISATAGVSVSASSIRNSGVISVAIAPGASTGPAVLLSGTSIGNSGSITVAGADGVSASGALSNAGSIVATGTALTMVAGTIDNSGTLQSTQGSALLLTGGGLRVPTGSNEGLIDGAEVGVSLAQASFTNSGTIRSAGTALVFAGAGASFANAVGGTLAGTGLAVDGASGAGAFVTLDNAGTIVGDVRLGGAGGVVTAETGSQLMGNLDLGSGAATFVTDATNTGPGAFAGVSGTITGTGVDTILYRAGQDATVSLAPAGIFDVIGYSLSNGAHLAIVSGDFSRSVAFTGNGSVDLGASISGTDATLVATAVALTSRGTLSLTHQSGSAGISAITGTGGIVNLGTINVTDATPGVVALTSAATVANSATGSGTFTNSGTIRLRDSVATVDTDTVVNTGVIAGVAGDRLSRGIVGTRVLSNIGSITVAADAVLLEDYLQPVSLTNSGSIASANGIAVAAPINPLTLVNQATGRISAGAGQPALFFASGSTIVNAGAIVGDLTTAYDSQGFYYQNGTYHRLSEEPLTEPFGSIPFVGGNNMLATTVHNTGTILGSVTLLGGNDRFENGGNVSGTIELGGGDDTYAVLAGDQVARGLGGTVDGGAGVDTIELHTTDGSLAQPVLIQTDRFNGFERLDQAEGVTAIAGAASFDSIVINGGTLTSLAGSHLTAGSGLVIATQGTLRLGGRIDGAVTVQGTLAPITQSATITGALTFAGGSRLAVSLSGADAGTLAVVGHVAVADGAILALSSATPITPGQSTTLLSASGGIDGRFAVDQASTVFGFVRQTADEIDLLGRLAALPTGSNPAAAVDAINGLLTSGGGSAALIAALPLLTNADGSSNAGALARLTPEPYADAGWMVVEDGLAVSRLARSGAMRAPSSDARPYMIAQGFGGWLHLGGSGAIGTAASAVSGSGAIGGFGFGSQDRSLALFGGYRHDTQTIGALGALTRADGSVVGMSGSFGSGRASFDATFAYLWGRPTTTRALPDGSNALSRYSLDGLLIDGLARYALAVRAWRIVPSIGLTYIGAERGHVVERGSAAFDIAVASRRQDVLFVDGRLRIAYGSSEDGAITPWVASGLRRTLIGAGTEASANFSDTVSPFAVPGAEIGRTQLLAEAGASMRPVSGIRISVAYQGAFGGGSHANAVTGGMTLGF